MPNVYLASDHAGFALKGKLLTSLSSLGYHVVDLGPASLSPDDDYPDFVLPCARKVAAEPSARGIVIGGSGQGEAMAANRVPGVRAAVYYGAPKGTQTDATGAELDLIASVRLHNDANMLSLGARFLTDEEALAAVTRFLSTPFSAEERHIRRIAKF